MLIRTFLMISVVSLLSCKQDKMGIGYEVHGTVRGVPDSTMVYMRNDGLNDSTMVIGERFVFMGKVKEPTWTLLFLENLDEPLPMWLENVQIRIEALNNRLTEVKVSGGEVQSMAIMLAERSDAVRTAMDSLGNIMALPELTDLRKDSVQALYRKLQQDEIALEKDFIRENPNSPVSAFILNRNRTRWKKTSVENLFSQLKDSAKETVYGKLLDRYIKLNKNPEVGDGYVDFVQEKADGESTRLSDLMGKYTLVEFWASWCVPCRKSNPELSKLYSRYRDKGLRIVGVSLDEDRESWLDAIEDDALEWDNVTDLKFNENEAALVYGVVGIPDNFLIDDKGIIVARNLREKALDKKLKEVFRENPTFKQKTD